MSAYYVYPFDKSWVNVICRHEKKAKHTNRGIVLTFEPLSFLRCNAKAHGQVQFLLK